MTSDPLILVTGATGFVGSLLVRRLVAEGHRVRILRRELSKLDVLGGATFEEVVGDLADAESVERAVQGCHVVFHCAALIQYWDDQNAVQTAINVDGTRHLIEAALRHRIERFIHVSSISAIGYELGGKLADENTIYNMGPICLNYADTKYAAERIVTEGVERGLDAVMVNPGSIYGAGDRRRTDYIKGLMAPFSSTGGIAVVDVEDVVDGCMRAWKQGKTGQRYVLISENLTFQEIGRTFARLARRTGPRIVLPGWLIRLVAYLAAPLARLTNRRWSLSPSMARAAHLRFYFSNARARQELGMSFRPFAETAQRTITWMRQRGFLSG